MYKGILSSSFENSFKYNIHLSELPFGFSMPISREICVASDLGKRKFNMEIDSQDEMIYLKSSSAVLTVDLPCKVKCSLKDVTICKAENGYDVMFSAMRITL